MKKIQQGFTLIELMIVVAIIAILAAIAIPAYQDYVIRSQVSEGMSLADGAKTAITEFYSNYGHFPKNNQSAGLAKNTSISGKYVTQLDVSTNVGRIEVTFGKQANTKITGKLLSLSAITHTGSTEWSCKKSTVDSKYLPSSCRN
ncbi:MAG: pilin [Mizugakiibacter sp.]|uniref:pilin n=1 Tax=Mizugakiibacter sp. TaxID=1972610 RepID=UPI00320E7743